MTDTTIDIYDRLQSLGISLQPTSPPPGAAYAPYARSGNLLFLSGHLAKSGGEIRIGKLGESMSVEDGRNAARAVAIDLLATLHVAAGDLNCIARIVKVMGLVNSTADFTEPHIVTNGASDLLNEVFGPAGRHARSAFSVTQLPMGACVEIELIAEILEDAPITEKLDM